MADLMRGVTRVVLRILRALNNLVHVPVLEYLLSLGFWGLMLLLGPVRLVFYLLLGVVDVCSGYVWWTYDEPTDDRPIVITGCDTGFGHDLAIVLNAAGWRVYAGCRSEKDLASLSAKCAGGKLTAVMLDVTNNEHVQALRKRLEKECPKGLYALVNNAGVGQAGLVDWMPLDGFRQIMEVNFFAPLNLIQTLLPLLKDYGRGARVVNTSSMAGLCNGGPAMGAYSSSKHAIETMSSCLRAELHHWGIHVCVVNPGFHKTALVAGMTQSMRDTYAKLPPHKQQEYGTDFLESSIFAIGLSEVTSQDPIHVVKAMTHAATGTHPRGQYIVGLDAKYLYLPMTALPHRVVDFCYTRIFTATPARLIKTSQAGNKLKAP